MKIKIQFLINWREKWNGKTNSIQKKYLRRGKDIWNINRNKDK